MSPPQAPVFIIGNPRSGTTLLRLMLTCHPRIVIPPEAGFMIQLRARHGDFRGGREEIARFVADLMPSPKFEHWKLPESVVREFLESAAPTSYAGLVSGVYECYASVHQPGKTRWGDKNNFHLGHIDTIAGLFPGAVFLHIVRDGRDVACSYRSLSGVQGQYAPVLPGDAFDAVCDWTANLEGIRRAFSRVGWNRVCELRYEDLVHDAESVLRKLCGFLGEEFSAEMLEYDRVNRERELEPREFDAWKRKNREGIDASAIGRWKNELSHDEVETMELRGGDLLARYGYEVGSRTPGLRLRASYVARALAFRGRCLRKRLRALMRRLAGR